MQRRPVNPAIIEKVAQLIDPALLHSLQDEDRVLEAAPGQPVLIKVETANLRGVSQADSGVERLA